MNPPGWSTADHEALAEIARAASGLAFGPARRAEAEHRIRQAMQRAQVTDLAGYRALVEYDQDARDELVAELSVGETYFFRDPQHFQFVRDTVLPELRNRRGRQHVVRAWSAGCSSGEEAYSLAILFEEEGLAEDRSRILANDVSRRAVRRTQDARYRPWSLRGVDGATIERYFSLVPSRDSGAVDDYIVADRIRRRVRCDYLNLVGSNYPSADTATAGADLIFCRNVLIYFDQDTIDAVLRRLADCLADGGWLIPGPSDPTARGDVGLETQRADWGLYYRRGHRDQYATTSSLKLSPVKPLNLGPTPATPSIFAASAVSASLTELPQHIGLFAAALAALGQGDYRQAATLAEALPGDEGACALHVRALANFDLPASEELCRRATARHVLAVELHYLHAAVLVGLGHFEEAGRSAARVVYIDRTSAAGHFLLASIRLKQGDRGAARRGYRNAHALCSARPGDEIVPLGDGIRADRMAEVAAAELRLLDAPVLEVR